MTFDDNIKQLLVVCLLSVGCWAPEVRPPEKKKSPAELAGLAISTANASTTIESSNSSVPEAVIEDNIEPQTLETRTEKPTIPSEMNETEISFPFRGILTEVSVPLLGHGGGTILEIDNNGTSRIEIEVLEKRNGLYRVICKNCNVQFPFQAGWIDTDFIDPS